MCFNIWPSVLDVFFTNLYLYLQSFQNHKPKQQNFIFLDASNHLKETTALPQQQIHSFLCTHVWFMFWAGACFCHERQFNLGNQKGTTPEQDNVGNNNRKLGLDVLPHCDSDVAPGPPVMGLSGGQSSHNAWIAIEEKQKSEGACIQFSSFPC